MMRQTASKFSWFLVDILRSVNLLFQSDNKVSVRLQEYPLFRRDKLTATEKTRRALFSNFKDMHAG